jgi:hypothetical protein
MSKLSDGGGLWSFSGLVGRKAFAARAFRSDPSRAAMNLAERLGILSFNQHGPTLE